MKKIIHICLFLLIPFLACSQMNNNSVMRKMMAPSKLNMPAMVKRIEGRIEKDEKKKLKLNKELEELKNKLANANESDKNKITENITKVEEKIDTLEKEISNFKVYVMNNKEN